jgi:hypothetical protein
MFELKLKQRIRNNVSVHGRLKANYFVSFSRRSIENPLIHFQLDKEAKKSRDAVHLSNDNVNVYSRFSKNENDLRSRICQPVQRVAVGALLGDSQQQQFPTCRLQCSDSNGKCETD